MTQPTAKSLLADIYQRMSPARRRQFYLVLALMFAGAVAELITIGAILPFLGLLAGPENVEVGGLSSLFGAVTDSEDQPRYILITGVFASVALAAGAVRLALAWVSHAFSFRLGHELGVQIQERLLNQPYSFHVQRNSSEMIAAHEKVQVLTFNVLLPMMVGVSSIFIATFIVAILIYIDPFASTMAAIAFCLIYVIVSYATRRRLHSNSDVINAAYGQRVQTVQESLGGIRDIIIDQSQPLYVEQFRRIDRRFRDAQAINLFIGAAPRFVIEAAGMILIAGLALLLTGRSGGLMAAIPTLGALALGAQRLLPLLQQVYYGWAQVRGNWSAAYQVVDLLRLPMSQEGGAKAAEPLAFRGSIRFERVSFRYPGRTERVLSDIDLTISKGNRVALIGRTGSGKSTMVDLLMGLLEPDEGALLVDGVQLVGEARLQWQKLISHVPQNIFMADTTIERNIAFGIPEVEIEGERVREAARQAQLDEFLQELPDGYQTLVGERGVRLSGGQRQRLGIARALYKKTSVLILDEATSALDSETEAAVMRSLRGLDEALTVVMIAHRLSTVASCDVVVRLEGGMIAEMGSFESIVGASALESI